MSATDKFAEASAKFTAASTTIGKYGTVGTEKVAVLDELLEQIKDGIEAMKAGLSASATPAVPAVPAAAEGGSKNKKNNKDKDNKDKKSKNNR